MLISCWIYFHIISLFLQFPPGYLFFFLCKTSSSDLEVICFFSMKSISTLQGQFLYEFVQPQTLKVGNVSWVPCSSRWYVQRLERKFSMPFHFKAFGINYFFHCYDQIPNRNALRKENIIWAPSLWEMPIHCCVKGTVEGAALFKLWECIEAAPHMAVD